MAQQQRYLSPEAGTEYSSPRYDAAMQQRVIALALQLQREHQETLTAEQIEAAAEEVGLEPEFVRQAIAQLSTEQAAAAARGAKKSVKQQATPQTDTERNVSWAWTLIGGFIYFFVKGWWKAGLASLLLYVVTGGLSWLIIPFFSQRFVETIETWTGETSSGSDPARTSAALQHLADLHNKGLISDGEYQTKRSELLSRL